MPRKISMRADQVHDCPVFQSGDRMVASLPEMLIGECDGLCAIAISDLLPWTIKLTAGGEPNDEVLLCRGCRGGRAQAGFRLEALGEADAAPQRTEKLGSLKQIQMFSSLPDRQLAKIEPMIKEVEYAPQEEIITFGAPGKALSIIIEGEVEVLRPDDRGKEKLLGVLKPGDVFGEMSLLTGDKTNATIRAKDEPVKAMVVYKEDFDSLLMANPVLNRYFSKLLALRLNQMSKQFTDQETGAVTGDLQMIGPTELIQAITVTDRTGWLRIKSTGMSLDMLFHSGQIWSLEAESEDDIEPEEVFYRFLGWNQGAFSFEPVEDAPKGDDRAFFKDTTSLLLEGMRRMDETDVPA